MFYKISSPLEKEKCIEIIEEKTFETFSFDTFTNIYKNLMSIIFKNKKYSIILLGKFNTLLPMACIFYCKVNSIEDSTVIKGIVGINPIIGMMIPGLLAVFFLIVIKNLDIIFLLGNIALLLFIYLPYHLQKKSVKSIPQEICELIDGKLEKI